MKLIPFLLQFCKVAVAKLKKRNKIIRIDNNFDADWSQVVNEM